MNGTLKERISHVERCGICSVINDGVPVALLLLLCIQ